MALLPFEELIKIDVRPFCETRKAKDDNGNVVDVPYLNWAKCVKLLHENGAKDVWFTPRICPETKTYLWPQADVTTRKGYKTQCWFVSVEIHIDELVFNMDTPLLNGALVVYEDTLNQLRISNAQARAFVKGVALRTGLGFDLWAESGDGDDGDDDLSRHNIWAIRERLERAITAKEKAGLDHKDLLAALRINDKQLNQLMGYFAKLDNLEKAVSKL